MIFTSYLYHKFYEAQRKLFRFKKASSPSQLALNLRAKNPTLDSGSAVLETALVIVVLIAIGVLFHSQISAFAADLFSKAFDTAKIPG